MQTVPPGLLTKAQGNKGESANVHSKAKQTSRVLYSYSISLHFPPNKKEGSIPFLELHSFVVYATVTHGIKILGFICIKLIGCLETLVMS